jgi:hypothetical protein
MGPITAKQLWQGPQEGSNIGRLQGMMGIRSAPSALQDPEGTTRGLKSINAARERKEKMHERKKQRLYE